MKQSELTCCIEESKSITKKVAGAAAKCETLAGRLRAMLR